MRKFSEILTIKPLRDQVFTAALLLSSLALPASSFACPDIDGLVDINCDGQLVITTFGDSITAGVRDELALGYPGRLLALLPNSIVFNVGNPGEKTFAGRSRAGRTFAVRAQSDYVIVLEGVNDYFIDELERSSFETRDNLLSIVRAAESFGAVTVLGRLTQIKRPEQEPWVLSVNKRISSYTKVDFFSLGKGIISYDNLHPNGDGYQRMAELVLATLVEQGNLNRPIDSDLDGIYDFAESRFGTSLSSPDTDLDGLPDGVEVFQYGSSPLLVDSDSDGVSDLAEVNRGTDPASLAPVSPTLRSLEPVSSS